MTPYEFNEHAIGFNDAMRAEIDLQRSMAWSIAALSRAKTIPTYDKWMRGTTKARRLYGEEARVRATEHAEDVAAYEAYASKKEASE